MKGQTTMESYDAKRENTKGHFIKWSGMCFCCFILGFLLGVALDAKYRPNHILLYINPDGKVSLSPHPGDIINFVAFDDKTGANVKVKYTANLAPCDKSAAVAPPSTCVYAPFDSGPNLYLFGCTSAKGIPCFDPQYGPKCAGCPSTGVRTPFLSKLLKFLQVLKWDLEAPLGLMTYQQKLPQNQSRSTGGSQAGQVQDVTSAPPPRVQEYVAACYNGAPGVFKVGDTEPTDTTKTPIVAEPDDTISLTLYPPPNSYSTSGLKSVCAGGELGSGNPSCKINNPTASNNYRFMLNMACGSPAGSTQESIQIQNPTVPPLAGKK
jgi:hypothetical protein